MQLTKALYVWGLGYPLWKFANILFWPTKKLYAFCWIMWNKSYAIRERFGYKRPLRAMEERGGPGGIQGNGTTYP